MAVGPAGGGSNRQDHRQAQSDCEVEVQLGAEVGIMMTASIGRLRGHRSGEHGGTNIAQVEGRGADLGEADRWQVDLARHSRELARSDLVDVETGEAFHLAVPLLWPVIDVVVAEGSDVISGERAGAAAAADPAMRVDPRGAVAPGQRGAEAESSVELGEKVPVGAIGGGDNA